MPASGSAFAPIDQGNIVLGKELVYYEAPILQNPGLKLPYTVVMDALGSAVGGVLMQDQGEGLQPLALMSKALKPSER